MKESRRVKILPSNLRHYALILMGLWTATTILMLLLGIYLENKETLDNAHYWALANYEKDVLYRRWNAAHGGVYVPVSDQTPPSPYLSHIPERDLRTPSGRLLTLVNPAYMFRQVYALAPQTFQVRGHLTSLKPIRPENAPDAWETKALQDFERGKTEVCSLETIDGKVYMRLMRPLITEMNCLTCHAAQGYRAGDIRGGISVAVPMDPLWVHWWHRIYYYSLMLGLWWLLGIGGIFLGARRLGKALGLQKEVEEELAQTSHQNQVILETAGEGIFGLDLNGHHTFINPAAASMLGYEVEELIHRHSHSTWHHSKPDGSPFPAEDCPIHATLRDGLTHRIEDGFFWRKDGTGLPVEHTSTPIIEEGKIMGAVVTFFDITQRQQAEKALTQALAAAQQRRTEIAAVLEASQGVLEAHDFQEAAQTIFNSCKNLIGAQAGYMALLSADGNQALVQFYDTGTQPCTVDRSLPMPIRGLREKAYRQGEAVYVNDFPGSEYARLLPEGHHNLTNALFAPLRIKGTNVGLLGLGNKPGGFTAEDARLAEGFAEIASVALANKRAEEELLLSEAWNREVIRTTSDGFWRVDAQGRFLEINEAYSRLTGYSQDELMSMTVSDVEAQETPDETARHIRQIMAKGSDKFETRHRCKDGRVMDIEVNVNYSSSRGGQFFAFLRDITQRKLGEEALLSKTRELEKLNRLIQEQNQRLLELDRRKSEFLNIVAHDLRTPLTSIKSYADLLLMYKDEPKELQEEFLNTISKESDRLGNLINDFLDLARIEAGTMEYEQAPFSLAEVIQHSLSVYEGETRNRQIALNAVIDPDLPQMVGDRGRIGQVVANILSNAVKFTPQGGHIMVAAKQTSALTEAGPQPVVEVSVTDTGPGIEAKYHEKIFEKFGQVEDQEGRAKGGTGLGLAIAREIVVRQGGRIWVESESGQGARFVFTLPVKGSPKQG